MSGYHAVRVFSPCGLQVGSDILLNGLSNTLVSLSFARQFLSPPNLFLNGLISLSFFAFSEKTMGEERRYGHGEMAMKCPNHIGAAVIVIAVQDFVK